MDVKPGVRDITVYVAFRPFKDEWIERNEAVLQGLKWQQADGLKVKFICWPSEVETAEYASKHGYDCVVIPWYRHYLFPGPLHSFKHMFETVLMDCDTEIFVYVNGDIVLGPGICAWLQQYIERDTLYSLPRHNWTFHKGIATPEDFQRAVAESRPEEWTALDLFALRATDGRKWFIPTPPFLLTAGSMDSWVVVKAGDLGWRRVLVPPDRFRMLHIEHAYSHPLKPGASPEKTAKWAFNCGVYATATDHMPLSVRADASLMCFEGSERYKFKYGLPQSEFRDLKEVYKEEASS